MTDEKVKIRKYGISIPAYFHIYVDADKFDSLKYGEDDIYLEECIFEQVETYGGKFHIDKYDINYADMQIDETVYEKEKV